MGQHIYEQKWKQDLADKLYSHKADTAELHIYEQEWMQDLANKFYSHNADTAELPHNKMMCVSPQTLFWFWFCCMFSFTKMIPKIVLLAISSLLDFDNQRMFLFQWGEVEILIFSVRESRYSFVKPNSGFAIGP